MPVEPVGAFTRSHWALSALDAEACEPAMFKEHISGSSQVAWRLGLGAFTAEARGRLLVREPARVPSSAAETQTAARTGRPRSARETEAGHGRRLRDGPGAAPLRNHSKARAWHETQRPDSWLQTQRRGAWGRPAAGQPGTSAVLPTRDGARIRHLQGQEAALGVQGTLLPRLVLP